MAVPNAPLPLLQQVAPGTNITVTMTLQSLSNGANGFTQGGGTFNAGNPTATFTLAIPALNNATLSGTTGGQGSAAITNTAAQTLLSIIDQMWREGDFTVA